MNPEEERQHRATTEPSQRLSLNSRFGLGHQSPTVTTAPKRRWPRWTVWAVLAVWALLLWAMWLSEVVPAAPLPTSAPTLCEIAWDGALQTCLELGIDGSTCEEIADGAHDRCARMGATP